MQHSPDLLDQLPRLGDDVGPCEADDASHLHGVPACPGGTVTAEGRGAPSRRSLEELGLGGVDI